MSQTGEQHIPECFAYPKQQPSTGALLIANSPECEKVGRQPARMRDWVLVADALDRLLNFLDADRECAGQKYEIIRRKLIKYFECRGCLSPEDLFDETINRVARRIFEGKKVWTNNPATYFYGVARNVLREYFGAPERRFVRFECLPLPAHPDEGAIEMKNLEQEDLAHERLLELLDRCMQDLPAESRELIVSYYEGEKSKKIKNRKDLAKRLGIPPNALRIRVHRIREKLEKQVRDSFKEMPDLRTTKPGVNSPRQLWAKRLSSVDNSLDLALRKAPR